MTTALVGTSRPGMEYGAFTGRSPEILIDSNGATITFVTHNPVVEQIVASIVEVIVSNVPSMEFAVHAPIVSARGWRPAKDSTI